MKRLVLAAALAAVIPMSAPAHASSDPVCQRISTYDFLHSLLCSR